MRIQTLNTVYKDEEFYFQLNSIDEMEFPKVKVWTNWDNKKVETEAETKAKIEAEIVIPFSQLTLTSKTPSFTVPPTAPTIPNAPPRCSHHTIPQWDELCCQRYWDYVCCPIYYEDDWKPYIPKN
jgi:hypothetical protein